MEGKKRKKRLKRKAEVGFEFEEDDDKNGDRVSKKIGVKCKQSEPCARVLEMKWKGRRAS